MQRRSGPRESGWEDDDVDPEEIWTSGYIAHELETYGINVERGIGGTGILAILKGNNTGKIVMLRAQFHNLADMLRPGADICISKLYFPG